MSPCWSQRALYGEHRVLSSVALRRRLGFGARASATSSSESLLLPSHVTVSHVRGDMPRVLTNKLMFRGFCDSALPYNKPLYISWCLSTLCSANVSCMFLYNTTSAEIITSNIHTYIRTCIHTYIHTYMYTCMHTYIISLNAFPHSVYMTPSITMDTFDGSSFFFPARNIPSRGFWTESTATAVHSDGAHGTVI